MILITLALLLAEPVHEEPVRDMSRHDGTDHDDRQTRRGKAGEKPDQQPKTPEKLPDDDQERNDPGQVHHVRKKSYRAAETDPAVPAQKLLRTVRKHDDSERHAKNQAGPTLISLK